MGSNPALSLYLKIASLTDVLHHRRIRRGVQAAESDPRATELLGQPGRTRPEGPLLWAQAADAAGLIPLSTLSPRLGKLLNRPFSTLLTSPDVPPEELIQGAVHQLTPADSLPSVERFLDHWRPDVGIFSGDGISPALIHAARSRSVPVFWVNATLERGALRWKPWLKSVVQDGFSHVFAVTEADAEALRAIGVPADRIDVVGRLLEDGLALRCNEAERDSLAGLLAARPVWLATPVTLEDLPAIHAAHQYAARLSHRLLLILAPATPEAGPEIAAWMDKAGWTVGLRSDSDEPEPETQVYVADGEGELGLWYRLAPITFVARSLMPNGGAGNPFEPAALGSAVLHGPHVGLHGPRFDRLSRAGASRLVRNASELGMAVQTLLAPDKTAAMAEAAWRVTSEGAEASDKVLSALVTTLKDREAAT